MTDPTEPVAWAFKYDDGTWHDPSTTEHSSGMRPLFAERKPLTEAQVQALIEAKHFRSGYELKASDQVCLEWYRLGLRDGERAHGIKGDQNGTDT